MFKAGETEIYNWLCQSLQGTKIRGTIEQLIWIEACSLPTKNLTKFNLKSMTAELIIPCILEERAAVPHIDWQKLYEAAMLEMNPDKLPICIGAAEQAITQRESLVDTTELERHKLADARSMLKSLSRIFLP
ncbi:MAG TPA: hypothetical protein VFQ43_13390 [Nitrososphaera sp.]|nr:hypothetical protein [Nitrososphaera sp.]